MCIDPHQTGFVGKGGDHLQLIKFWPFHAPAGRGLRRGEIFGSALLQPARQCLRGALKMQDRKMTDKDIAGGGKCRTGI